jgi:hypothetical protein
VTTGYNLREGAAEITARLLREPANWPSQAEGSQILASRFARAELARRQIRPFLVRYESRVSVAA